MQTVTQTLHRERRLPEPKAVLELFKPVTWFPPMWAFACGAVSAGIGSEGIGWTRILIGLVVAGPLVCATSQAVNDWFDRHVDALNEPHRPIPSGRIPGRMGLHLAVGWTLVSLVAALLLGTWGFIATAVALLMAWGYSAPPLRFKQNGWIGNLAVGLSYEGLAWITGAAVVLGGALPPTPILLVALLYSLGAHGIMTLNDFKSRKGDLEMGIRSIPAMLGPTRAAWTAAWTMLVPQAVVVALLVFWGQGWAAWTVAGLMTVQVAMLRRLLSRPDEARALWYSAFGVPVYVAGMMVTALAL
ncbi:MAG: chlorophyll synthase ChlG [Gemmatimonadota bacterium]|jgi:chlorophyll synthase